MLTSFKGSKAFSTGLALLLALLCMGLGAKAQAQAFDLTAAADTYVTNDNTAGPATTHAGASNAQMRYFRSADGTNRRMAVTYVRFNLGAAQTDPGVNLKDVQLSFGGFSNSVTTTGGNRPLHVYGVNETLDGADLAAMSFDNGPGLNPGTPAAYDPTNQAEDRAVTLDGAEITPELITYPSPGIGLKALTPISTAMDDFVNADTDGILLFMIVPNGPASDPAGVGGNAVIDSGCYFITLETTIGAVWNPDATFRPRIIGTTIAAGPPVKTAHWPLDETTGSNANEIVGNRDGTLVNFGASPAWNAGGKSNGSLDFDGIDDHITVADSATTATNFLATESFSFSFLMKMNGAFTGSGPITRDAIISKGTYAATTGVRVEVFNDGSNLTFSVDDGTVQADCVASNAGFITNTWNHVVCVRNAGTHKLTIYLNGASQAEVNDTTTGTLSSGAETLDIGYSVAGDKPASVGYFKGSLDDVRIYRTALSTDNITDIRADYAADNAARIWTVFE